MRYVLIADDDPDIRQLVAVTLDSSTYSILEAEDGDRAWELILRYRPTVAVLDVGMPGKGGLELAEAIRTDATLAGMKVILLTAFSGEQHVEAGMRAGADYYLAKPFSPLQLMTLVDQAVEGS
ncbi:MAG TPA: response regulator [Chloroflexota bacterium]|jgi:DNA-binding response OmpR family regulator|nr:response regulator [Chloroflexota bacterium]